MLATKVESPGSASALEARSEHDQRKNNEDRVILTGCVPQYNLNNSTTSLQGGEKMDESMKLKI